MPIPDKAKQWGLSPKFLDAIEQAEGGPDALVRAVRCSVQSVTGYEQALDILCRSVVHALSDFGLQPANLAAMVQLLGNRWAPVGAANDPTNLNTNWVPNVLRIYRAPNAKYPA